MILVDTSVWIEHVRSPHAELSALLENGSVIMHPFVEGELSCGSIASRGRVLARLRDLPHARIAEHEHVAHLVETHRLWGTGLGWIDAHLLAASILGGHRLWTLDRALHAAATSLGVAG